MNPLLLVIMRAIEVRRIDDVEKIVGGDLIAGKLLDFGNRVPVRADLATPDSADGDAGTLNAGRNRVVIKLVNRHVFGEVHGGDCTLGVQ